MNDVKGYTPGPWSLERDCNKVPEFVFGGDTCVCDFGIEVPKPEDARLIAAAPELYEALQEALVNIERVLRGDRKAVPFRAEWIEEARAICAKVKESDQG